MKALSFAQPAAELIMRGLQTVEIRGWQHNIRGRIAVHAPQRVDRDACQQNGLDPKALVTGAVVGTVVVAAIQPVDANTWQRLRAAHLLPGDPPEQTYAWHLRDPERLPEPMPCPGRKAWFEVPLAEDGQIAQVPLAGMADEAPTEPTLDQSHPFALLVEPEEEGAYALEVVQRPNGALTTRSLVRVGGARLIPALDVIVDALRRAGYAETELRRGRQEPFLLSEEHGVRVALTLEAVAPLARRDRAEAAAQGVAAMTAEEAYYWFSKITAGGNPGRRAARALRLLLADDE